MINQATAVTLDHTEHLLALINQYYGVGNFVGDEFKEPPLSLWHRVEITKDSSPDLGVFLAMELTFPVAASRDLATIKVPWDDIAQDFIIERALLNDAFREEVKQIEDEDH
tara:strand:+ start:89 stop:421 length:333 start_codon:yes stop_codon:yes gene_type:complete